MHALRASVICVLCFCCTVSSLAQEVTVVTDKTSYKPSGKIKITFTNNLKENIFSAAASKTPEFSITNCERKKSQWSWDAYRPRCPWPECDKGQDKSGQIRPGKSVSFTWVPRIYSNNEYRGLLPGLYRLTFMYQVLKSKSPEQWQWNTVKSNEFTIEETR